MRPRLMVWDGSRKAKTHFRCLPRPAKLQKGVSWQNSLLKTWTTNLWLLLLSLASWKMMSGSVQRLLWALLARLLLEAALGATLRIWSSRTHHCAFGATLMVFRLWVTACARSDKVPIRLKRSGATSRPAAWARSERDRLFVKKFSERRKMQSREPVHAQ